MMGTCSGTFRVILAALALLAAGSSAAEPIRGLPRGEARAEVIERIFTTPTGDLRITTMGLGGHSAYLRGRRGSLMGFQFLSGAPPCDRWFQSSEKGPLPEGCEFVFRDLADGTFHKVVSRDMREANLFQAMRGFLRGWRNYVAL